MALIHLNSSLLIIDEMLESKIIKLRRKRSQIQQTINQLRSKQLMLLLSLNDQRESSEPGFWELQCEESAEEFFKTYMRMGRHSFYKLCQMITFARPISRKKSIAMSLHILGSQESLRAIGSLYKMGTPAVQKNLRSFCTDVNKNLAQRCFIDLSSDTEAMRECVEGFKNLGFPQCLGTVNRCPVLLHGTGSGYSTMTMTLAVDYRGRFLFVKKVPDDGIDESILELERCLRESSAASELTQIINDTEVPVYLLGDSSFQLSAHIMTPYSANFTNTDAEERFNSAVVHRHKMVDVAFEQVKTRFARFMKSAEHSTDTAVDMFKACCVLHNYMMDEKDPIEDVWRDQLANVAPNERWPKRRESFDFVKPEQDNGINIRRALLAHIFS